METATQIADDLLKELTLEDWLSPKLKAIRTANQVLSRAHETRKVVECLCVVSKPIPQMFHLHYGVFDPAVMQGTGFSLEHHIHIIGDQSNAACFWTERYCRLLPLQPIKRLIPLAVHLINSARILNSAAIDGIEIFTADEFGVRRVSDESIENLATQSNSWDREIENLICGHSQEFTYAPNVAG
jgi:hypothetical protein